MFSENARNSEPGQALQAWPGIAFILGREDRDVQKLVYFRKVQSKDPVFVWLDGGGGGES